MLAKNAKTSAKNAKTKIKDLLYYVLNPWRSWRSLGALGEHTYDAMPKQRKNHETGMSIIDKSSRAPVSGVRYAS